MNDNTEQLKRQSLAVHGFIEWLTPKLPELATELDKEFSEQLLQLLKLYEWELDRRIEGSPANQSWFDLVALSSVTAALLKDELLEIHQELADYHPADDPKTVEQMTVRLLSDALVLFEDSQKEMAVYLPSSAFPVAVNNLAKRLLALQ